MHQKKYFVTKDDYAVRDIKDIQPYGDDDNYVIDTSLQLVNYVERMTFYGGIIKSLQNPNDFIFAIEVFGTDFSFLYHDKKYKITKRIRNNIATDFDFENTVCENDVFRQIKFGELPDRKQSFLSLCEDQVSIISQKIQITGREGKMNNVFVFGNNVCIGSNTKNVMIRGNDITIGQNSSDITIDGFCEKIHIGEDCKSIQIGSHSSDILIKQKCQNVRLGRNVHNVQINQQSGIDGQIQIASDCGIDGQIFIGQNSANFGMIQIGSFCARNGGQIQIMSDCASQNGQIQIQQKCAQDNGLIFIDEQSGSYLGQIQIQAMSAQNGQITLDKLSGSGKNGMILFQQMCAHNGIFKISIGLNQKLFVRQSVQNVILKNTSDFDSANFIYMIKRNVDSNLVDIQEYQSIGKEDEYMDMFDSFDPKTNYKMRI